jgi:hypothetical protein
MVGIDLGGFSDCFCLTFLSHFLSVFCLNQDLQDIRDFQDGRLMCGGRFSGSTILSEPGFAGY